jgi:hypothetical protein
MSELKPLFAKWHGFKETGIVSCLQVHFEDEIPLAQMIKN